MSSPGSSGSALESATGAVGPGSIEAFEILSNETRLAILLALWDAYDPHATDNTCSFTELRERIGMRQGGQFNYHLDKLVGRFVRKTDTGYELKSAGLTLLQGIIARTGLEDQTFEPTEIDDPCDLCGAPTAIAYERGRVYQLCTACPGSAAGTEHPDGALIAWTFEPTGVADRSAEELFAASTIKNFGRIAMRFEALCPDCSGPVEWSIDICDDHEPGPDGSCPDCGRTETILAKETCTVCKSYGYGSPSIKVLLHPAVVSFFYDHGVEIGFTGHTDYADVARTLALVDTFEETVDERDPPRIRVTISYEGDELHLLLDETMSVVEVHDSR